jgi:hypothetical protein
MSGGVLALAGDAREQSEVIFTGKDGLIDDGPVEGGGLQRPTQIVHGCVIEGEASETAEHYAEGVVLQFVLCNFRAAFGHGDAVYGKFLLLAVKGHLKALSEEFAQHDLQLVLGWSGVAFDLRGNVVAVRRDPCGRR